VQEWEYAKVRQDAQLERIERGVGTLGDMAKGMQEELDKQNPVIDDIDMQLNKVTSQLKTNNAKLKGLITQVCCAVVWMGYAGGKRQTYRDGPSSAASRRGTVRPKEVGRA